MSASSKTQQARLRQRAWAASLVLALAAAHLPTPAQAQSTASEASALSVLPVALVLVAPGLVLAGGAVLTVRAVEASAEGSEWVLEQASDGARVSLRVAGQGLVAVGQAITVTAVATGWLLSSAGQVLAYVPNTLGRGLSHHQRVSG